MTHTCFHAIADHHNQYADSFEEARKITDEWVEEGDAHIQIYKISTDEISDYIDLDEELIYTKK
jgi:dihydropteroate synthase